MIALLREGKHVNDILAGICDALTERVQRLIRQVGLTSDFAISGGIVKNKGIVTRLEKALEISAHIAPDPQIIGALGAALFAEELEKKKRTKT